MCFFGVGLCGLEKVRAHACINLPLQRYAKNGSPLLLFLHLLLTSPPYLIMDIGWDERQGLVPVIETRPSSHCEGVKAKCSRGNGGGGGALLLFSWQGKQGVCGKADNRKKTTVTP